MKHLKTRAFYAVAVLCIVLCSCGSADKNALPVPTDAAIVMHINTKSLTSKLTMEDLRNTNWYKMQGSPGEQVFRDLMQNPDTTGIDLKEDMAFFVRRLKNNQGYFAFTGRIKNAATFEAFNKKAAGNSATAVTKDGEVSSMSVNERALVSWKGDKFVYVIDAATPSFDPNRLAFPGSGTDSVSLDDTSSVYFGDTTSYEATLPPPGDLKGYARNLFNLKGDSLLIEDSRYADLLKQDGDMHLWSNAEHTLGSDAPGFLSMLKLEKYLKGSVTASTLSFENGKMVMRAKVYSNKEMTELFKKYESNDLNAGLIGRIPSDNVAAVIAMNYKPEGLKAFLQLGGLDGMVNGFLGEAGITLDDFVAANKGDLLVAVTDPRVEQYTIDMGDGSEKFTGTKPNANFVFVTTIGNKAAFDKLVTIGKKFNERQTADTSVFYNMNNELFVCGSSQQMVDQYLQGGKKDFAFASKITDHPFGLYVDLQKFIRGFASTAQDTSSQNIANASLAMWQDIVVTGGEFKDGGIVQDLEINLVDKNTNSLKQLNQYFDKIASTPKRGF